MITTWILIVTTLVYGGSTITFQEFTGEPSCTRALAAVKDMRAVHGAVCVPKGQS